MSYLVKSTIIHNGKDYAAGDHISDLQENEAKRLLDLDVIEDPHADPEGEVEDITPEQFAGLKADEQKAELVQLDIEPAANASDRLKQYTDWYNEVG